MRHAIAPFTTLYNHFIKDKEPMISAECSLGQAYQAYMYDIAEYLLDELYTSVKTFKSDFLLDWTHIMDAMKIVKPYHTMVFPIAFRENGVDGPNYIVFRAGNGMNYFQEVYASKKIYLIACVADDTDVHLSLYPIYDDIVSHFDLFQDDIPSQNNIQS